MREQIGPYRVQRELGRGGMGVVYAASDPAGREVALKVLPTRGAARSRLERFKLECEALARLRHPNVIPVHTAGEVEGYAYYAMPLVAGGSLADRVERGGPLAAREVVEIGLALCDALSAAHEISVLHRDLKPENVLFGPSGQPLLADFGLVRSMFETDALTKTGAFVGSPGYMAPEQARGDRDAQGPPTDVYGLGATLYYALTTHAPIQGESMALLVLNTEEQSPPPPSSYNADVPPGLEGVVLRCLSKQPRQRYPTAVALRQALLDSLADPGRRSVWPWVGALGVLALGVGVGVAALGPDGRGGEQSARKPPAPPASGDLQAGTQEPASTGGPSAHGEVKGAGPTPWEREGLPRLELSVADAIAQARQTLLEGDFGQSAMLYEYAYLNGAADGGTRLEFEAEYTDALSERLEDLWYGGWRAESVLVARKLLEIAGPYWSSEFDGMEEFAKANMFQTQYANAHRYLAHWHLAQEEFDAALAELDLAAYASLDSPRLNHLRVEVLTAAGRIDDAEAQVAACCLRRAEREVAEAGHGAECRFRLALVELERGDRARAEVHLAYLREEGTDAMRFRAQSELDPAGQAAAREVVAAWLPSDLKSKEVLVHLRYARAHARLGDDDAAVDAYWRATKHDPACVEAWVGMAEARVRQNWSGSRLLKAGEALLEFPGQKALGLAYLTTGLRFEGRYAEAVKTGREALRLDPGLATKTPVARDLGLALVEVGELEAAAAMTELLQQGPAYRQAQARDVQFELDRERDRRGARR